MRAIEEFVEGRIFEAFCSDRKTVDAVVRNLEVIGEAARYVTGWKTALSGCFEQRRLYLIGHIDGHEPVGRV